MGSASSPRPRRRRHSSTVTPIEWRGVPKVPPLSNSSRSHAASFGCTDTLAPLSNVNTTEGKLTAEGGAIEIPLPPRFREAVGVDGRRLVAGFRPEHMDIANGQNGSTGARVRAKADVVEYLGNEELLHVTALGKDIVAIVDSDNRVKPGDVLQMILPYTKLHLFDAESGASLISEREQVAA